MHLEPPDPGLDHFERLGLPREWGLSRDALQQAYVSRSREVHPDRFAGGSEQVQARARTHASLLNEAYQVLRDRVGRAAYLVKLAGFDLEQAGREGGAPAPSQAFLLEMMERRDAAEALTEDGQREALLDEVEAERAQTFAAAVEHLESGAFEDAARALLVLRYLDRFVESLEEALDKAG